MQLRYCTFALSIAIIGASTGSVYSVELSEDSVWYSTENDTPILVIGNTYSSNIFPLQKTANSAVEECLIVPLDQYDADDDSSVDNKMQSEAVTSEAAAVEGLSCPFNINNEGKLRKFCGSRSILPKAASLAGNKNEFGFFGGGDSGSALNELIDENKSSGGVLLVDFYANWCQPCRKMKEVLNAIENNYKDGKLVIHKIDVDQNQELSRDYEITALPTLVLFARGSEVKRIRGLVTVEMLTEVIDEVLDQLI